jgi:hypothetical protein
VRRILGDVFAPWVKELSLSVESIAPGFPGARCRAAHAILRTALP